MGFKRGDDWGIVGLHFWVALMIGLGYDALIPGRGVLGVSVLYSFNARYRVVSLIAFNNL